MKNEFSLLDETSSLISKAEAYDKMQQELKDGTLSDGYHSFNDLYYQRLVLSATICNLIPDKCWKSTRHNDGKLCFDGGWFIIGFDTPNGSYTYHYELKYWDMFKCKELEVGKKWDGHTDKDIDRLLSLTINSTKKIDDEEVIDNLSLDEKKLLVELILRDIRGNWINTERRKNAAYVLALKIYDETGDSLWYTLSTVINQYVCGEDGRYFRSEFPYGYENMEKTHNLTATYNDKSTDFKKLSKKYLTYLNSAFEDLQ